MRTFTKTNMKKCNAKLWSCSNLLFVLVLLEGIFDCLSHDLYYPQQKTVHDFIYGKRRVSKPISQNNLSDYSKFSFNAPQYDYLRHIVKGRNSLQLRKKSCPDRIPLRIRKDSSDLVFTGSLQWISPVDNKRRHELGAGVTGGILVKNVIKGSKKYEGKLLNVSGFGREKFCVSKVGFHETKIFLTSFDRKGKLKLSSSILRINGKNLRQLSTSISGKIYFIPILHKQIIYLLCYVSVHLI